MSSGAARGRIGASIKRSSRSRVVTRLREARFGGRRKVGRTGIGNEHLLGLRRRLALQRNGIRERSCRDPFAHLGFGIRLEGQQEIGGFRG